MSVKHKPTVDAYVANLNEATAALENLLEFVRSCPRPDSQGHLAGSTDYAWTGAIGHLAAKVGEAAQIADEACR